MMYFLHILYPDLKNKLSMHDEAHLQLNGDTDIILLGYRNS